MTFLKTLNRVLSLIIVLLVIAGGLMLTLPFFEDAPAATPVQSEEDKAQTAAINKALEQAMGRVALRPTPLIEDAVQTFKEESGVVNDPKAEKLSVADAQAKVRKKLEELPEPYRQAMLNMDIEQPKDIEQPPPEETRAKNPPIMQLRNEQGYMHSTLNHPNFQKKNKPRKAERTPIRSVPAFQINGISSADFSGKIFVLHLFSFWCADSVREREIFADFSEKYGVPLYGVNVFPKEMDDPVLFFKDYGSPYQKWGRDDFNLVSGAFSMYQTPSTYIIHGDTKEILWRHDGEITQKIWDEDFMPALENFKFMHLGEDS